MRLLTDIGPRTFVNGSGVWLERYPWAGAGANKYSRGHAVVVGGPEMPGAARLAALGARRIGAGLVTIAAPPEALDDAIALAEELTGRAHYRAIRRASVP